LPYRDEGRRKNWRALSISTIELRRGSERRRGRARARPTRRTTMRSLVMHKVNDDIERGVRPEPALIGRIGAFIGEIASGGHFLGGEGLGATSERVRLVFAKGNATLERGPLVGAHEPMADVAMLKVRSMDEAISWSTRIGEALGDGELEIGPVVEPWDLGLGERPAGEVPLRVLVMHKRGDGREPVAAGRPAVAALADELTKADALVTAIALEPSRKGARLRIKSGQRSVIDGPFAESKELIAGYSLLQTETLAEVIDIAFRFGAILGDIEMDVRPVAG
jgi:hypothetical protein